MKASRSQAHWWKLALVMVLGLGAGISMFVMTLRSDPTMQDAQQHNVAAMRSVEALNALVTSSEQRFSSTSLQGRYTLVYFGFTNCPDACPTALYNATLALNQLDPEASKIQPVFVTVDPARDTPQQLGLYLSNFSSTWLGLSGTTTQLAEVEQALGVIAMEHRDESLPGGYTMDHSNEFLLFSPAGKLLMRFAADQDAATLLAQLQSLTRNEAV